jgi:hypothetical protein
MAEHGVVAGSTCMGFLERAWALQEEMGMETVPARNSAAEGNGRRQGWRRCGEAARCIRWWECPAAAMQCNGRWCTIGQSIFGVTGGRSATLELTMPSRFQLINSAALSCPKASSPLNGCCRSQDPPDSYQALLPRDSICAGYANKSRR